LEKRFSSTDAPRLDPPELEDAVKTLANGLQFQDVDSPVESTRMQRAQATVAYITLCQKGQYTVDEEQRQLIQAWHNRERSGPVQRILNQALGKIDR
jgi:proteasome component ECM29